MDLSGMHTVVGEKGKFSWMLQSIQKCNRHTLYKMALDMMEGNNEEKAIASLIQKILYIHSMKNYENLEQNLHHNLHSDKIPTTLETDKNGNLSEKNQKILNCM